MRALSLLWGLLALHVGCNRAVRPSSDAPEPVSCPSDELIESLHAAAFYYENLPADAARAKAEQALALAASANDATSERLSKQLARMTTLDEGARRNEAEHVRVALADWACLTPQLHRAFHSRLPPLPGGHADY